MTRTLPLLAALLALPSAASAQDLDRVEHELGVSAVSAMSGNGGLTAGVSDRGEITVLSWPSPSHHDQIDHQTASGTDVRDLERFGAAEDRGVFAGLWIEPADGAPYISWIRDADWEHTQAYRSDTSPALEQSARLPGTGLSVFETTFVDPATDVLHRRATLQRDATSTVRNVRYLLYTNFAPQLDRPDDRADRPAFPPSESDDDRHDFAAFWDAERGALVHFAPAEPDASVLDELLAGDWSGEAWGAEGLDAARAIADAAGPGVFLTLTAEDAPDAVQVGWDTTRTCDGTAAWSWRPEAAWADAQDGTLTGSPLAACQADAVLAWDVDFGETGALVSVSLDHVLAVQGTSAESMAVAQAAAGGFDRTLTDADAAWSDWLGGLRIPTTLGEELQGSAQRTLISLAQGTSRDSGAVVASIARQPGYHLDAPRESAWIDLALDAAGDYDSVSRHSRFLTSVQNRAPEFDGDQLTSPTGAWLGGFWGDGQPASTVLDAFDLHTVGLTVWQLTAHATFAPNDDVRRDALASAWPAIARGANLLAGCVADDHPALDGQQAGDGEPAWYPAWQAVVAGNQPDAAARLAALSSDPASMLACAGDLGTTAAVRQGLLAAADAARVLCREDARSDYWAARAHELGAATLRQHYAAGSGMWQGDAAGLLWPAPLVIDAAHADLFGGVEAADDFVEGALLDAANGLHQQLAAHAALTTEGAAGAGLDSLALALFWTGDRRPDADVWVANLTHLERLAVDFAVPGTRHLGEVFVALDTDGDGTADLAEQRVATPHLGAASLTYLTALAIAQPERFDALELGVLDPVCPVGEQPVLSRRAADCDGCESNAAGGSAPHAALLLGLLALLRRRRS